MLVVHKLREYAQARRSLTSADANEAADEIERLHSALIQCGRSVGAGLADEVSTDFLMNVPGEVALKIARLDLTARLNSKSE